MVSPIHDFLSTLSTSQCWPTSSRHCVDIILAFAAYPYVLFTSSILFTSQYWPTSTRHYVYIVRLLSCSRHRDILTMANVKSIQNLYYVVMYQYCIHGDDDNIEKDIYIYWTWIKSYFKFLKTYEWIIKIET